MTALRFEGRKKKKRNTHLRQIPPVQPIGALNRSQTAVAGFSYLPFLWVQIP
jgi:hypothetical protein